MEKDKITENEAKEKEASNGEVLEKKQSNESNTEIEDLITSTDVLEGKESVGTGKEILVNILDQLILAAMSSVLVVIIDFCMNVAGYRFVRDNGSIIGAAAIIYFIFNCIYAPLVAKTKDKKTIAKKILSI